MAQYLKLLIGAVINVTVLLTASVNNTYEVSSVEKFLGLLVKKQNIIIDAALICFGANGYKNCM